MKQFSVLKKCISRTVLFLLPAAFTGTVTAQNIFPASGSAGIGTVIPASSSALEIKSTTQGFLIPRMTFAQKNTIASPVSSLMVYQTDNTPGFYFFNGSAWIKMAASDGLINGLAIGTGGGSIAFNTALGNNTLISNTTGYYNTASGYKSLYSNSTGYTNSATGAHSMYLNTTGSGNTSNGYAALYYNNSGSENTAIGNKALFSNTSGYSNVAIGTGALVSNNLAHNLVAVGDSALYNFPGSSAGTYANTAIGSKSLFTNTSGIFNTALGASSLYSNTIGSSNTACGENALYYNTEGGDNTANGTSALYANTIGSLNTANGTAALNYNTSGSNNSADGAFALYNTTVGSSNTANGTAALYTNTTGSYLTAFGRSADVNAGNYSNSSAVGYNAAITASNQVRLGNSNITSIGGFANWTNISDGRVKKNIKGNVPGLVFINKLQPVTYNLNLEAADKILQLTGQIDKDGKTAQHTAEETEARKAKEQVLYSGFIAQDVEKAAKELNYDFSGVDAAKNSKDLYGLRYSEFVVPLVKAVQELSKMNDDKDTKIDDLQKQINELKALIISGNTSTSASADNIHLQIPPVNSMLSQNIPNPFNTNTLIRYTTVSSAKQVQIIIFNSNGAAVKQFNNLNPGIAELTVTAGSLAAGSYFYSLIIDGKKVDTRQMIITK